MKLLNTEDKYCFLDIDGVLNTGHYSEHPKENVLRYLEESPVSGDFVLLDKLEMLQKWASKNKIKFVGVSSWFNSSVSKYPSNYEQIGKFLGLDVVGVTDYTGGGYTRGESVKRFAEENKLKYICILDDAWHSMMMIILAGLQRYTEGLV